MEEEGQHLDRQPPRDDAEAEEQDRLIAEAAGGGAVELPTEAPAPDVADDAEHPG